MQFFCTVTKADESENPEKRMMYMTGWVQWLNAGILLYLHRKGIILSRAPEFLSSRLNWVPPPPPPHRVCLPQGPKWGGRHTLACGGVGGGTQFRRMARNSGTLYCIISLRSRRLNGRGGGVYCREEGEASKATNRGNNYHERRNKCFCRERLSGDESLLHSKENSKHIFPKSQ